MKREGGFTLIEAMIALVVISTGLLALGSFTISVLRADATARARIVATHVAEQMLEEWSATGALATYFITIPGTNTYTPSDLNVTYTLTAATSPMIAPASDGSGNQTLTGTPTPVEKKVTVSWTRNGQTHSVYLTHVEMKP